MGHLARPLALIATAGLLASGCGDPVVVVGDFPGTVRIIAGIPDSAGASLGASATESLLDGPRGLAAGADGIVYIADYGNSRVLSVNPSGAIEALVDHSTRREEPRLRRPEGLALDGEGGLLIADPGGHRVFRLELASGELVAIAGTGSRGAGPDTAVALLAALDTPTGVAVAPDGVIYFTELGAHRVRRLEPDGTLVTFAGTGMPGFLGDGGPASQARLRQPAGLVQEAGILYIADGGNHRIRAVVLATSVITTVAGAGIPGFGGDGGPASDALLDTPVAVVVSANTSTLYVADSGNHRIRAINLKTRRISTFAGTGEELFNGDLLAAGQTALSSPRGLALSPFDLLFLSDTGHHLVRRTPVGFITVQ
jgi:DNA-binding beta-propeller fold protein YncE